MCHRPTQTRDKAADKRRQTNSFARWRCLYASLVWLLFGEVTTNSFFWCASMANMIFGLKALALTNSPSSKALSQAGRLEDSTILIKALVLCKARRQEIVCSLVVRNLNPPLILQVLKSFLWLFFTKVTSTYSGRMGLSNTRHGATWLSWNRAACSFRLAVCG